jgi:uncharacterized protein (TIGR02117 family)
MKIILKMILYLLAFFTFYLLIAYICSYIPVGGNDDSFMKTKTIYMNTTGVHLNIIIKKEDIDSTLLNELFHFEEDNYFSFGWGDRNFYLETPTWSDLTFSNAFTALFTVSPSLMYVVRYEETYPYWAEIEVTEEQLKIINEHIRSGFIMTNGRLQKIPANNYGLNDTFYEGEGSYSLFYTCNTWVNEGFKKADIEAVLWTLFDFPLMELHLNKD